MKAKWKQKKISAQKLCDEEINALKAKYASISCTGEGIKRFTDLPLSQKTLQGLTDSKYVYPTDIQCESILPALQGKDVLGAAITGSGKTLAFLIPVIEHLYVNKWSRNDGIGAIIISPTRELAYQIFETLKRIGHHHDFSAGLIIGGKNLKFERKRMDQCNILICTPGRLLQHMDENPLFDATTVEMLVLDEADRCLDMGFEQTLNAIIENFPPKRQTLLFSATQTNSIKDLARLNLHDPVYIGQQKESDATKVVAPVVPDLLQQNYVVVALEDKITMLWSFIKNHLKQKIIVFLASCKQVKYVYEIFCKLRPGTSLLGLYGTLHQDRRIAIYNEFVRKSNVVLFATDIASRGLDFPTVNWVVQLDCPEDVKQYIHRAGRSARNKTRGESLLVLMPTEEKAMIEDLKQHNLQIQKIHIDPKKMFSPRVKIEASLAQNPELKASAQRAFIAYIKSVFLMKNKKVFKVFELDFDAYAKSLGLVVTPRVRFLERFMKKQNKFAQESAADSDSDTSMQKLGPRDDDEEESDDDFIKVKRINHEIQNDKSQDEKEEEQAVLLPIPKKEKVLTKAALAKKALKKKLQVNEKVKFDDEGREIIDKRKQLQSALAKEYANAEVVSGIDIETAKQLLMEEDKYDKERFRELVKQRHKKMKEKAKKHERGEFSSGDGDDDEGENSVDLSWLPDPDRVFKKETETEDNDESVEPEQSSSDASSEEDEYDEDEPVAKKSKVTSKLTLDDAEIIAAQLLAKSN